jgi:hypothetical protein
MNSPFDLHGRSAGARDWSAMALGAMPSTIEEMMVSWGAKSGRAGVAQG